MSRDRLIGREVAVYRIEELLGEGGFAYVYRARDRSLDIDVALKVLKPHFAHDEVFEENFRTEAHRAAKVRHPGIITIHYAGKEDDVVFFSMDYLERGLSDLLAERKPLEQNLILKVGMDVSSALGFAHRFEGGLVHRDLKPDNILFDAHGNAVVTDFGIAEVVTNYTEATGTTVSVGTPKYMSPEQARGHRTDQRSDIYSFGVTLYEMATGEAPFTGRDWFELGRKHIEEPPPSIREKNPDASPGLERIILKCMEKDPDDRYDTAEALREEMAAMTGGMAPTVVIPARPKPKKEKAPAPAEGGQPGDAVEEREEEDRAGKAVAGEGGFLSRHRSRVLAAAAVLLLLAGGAYAADAAGIRSGAEARWPALRLFGGAAVTAGPPAYPTVNGAAEVTGPFGLSFSGPVDASSATPESVLLLGPDSSRVPVEIRVDADGRALEVSPREPLEYGTEYVLVTTPAFVGTGGEPVAAEGGAAAEAGMRFAFVTRTAPRDEEPPALASSDPERDAEAWEGGDSLTLVFSEALDSASVDSTTVGLFDADGTPVAAELVCCADSPERVVLVPEGLRAGRTYVIRLGAGIADTAGNAMAADSLRFALAAAARPASGPGWLTIRVAPESLAPFVSVVVDGEGAGRPPVSRHQVTGGRAAAVSVVGSPPESGRRITLYSNRFSVDPGQTRTLPLEVPSFGAVTVLSAPAGSLVFIDGTQVGSTPLARYPVRAGSHTVEVRPREGAEAEYGTHRETVEVGALEWTKRLSVTLPPRG